jgi:hypothetical protein
MDPCPTPQATALCAIVIFMAGVECRLTGYLLELILPTIDFASCFWRREPMSGPFGLHD